MKTWFSRMAAFLLALVLVIAPVIGGAYADELPEEPDFFLSQPADIVAVYGTEVSASVSVREEGVTYQWQYQTAGSEIWKNSGLASAKTDTYAFRKGANDNYMWMRCIVTDARGEQHISDAAICRDPKELQILVQPEDIHAALGSPVAAYISVDGDGVRYQWQYCLKGSTVWKNSGLASAKTDSYAFNIGRNDNGMRFRCVVSDGFGRVAVTEEHTCTLRSTLASAIDPEPIEALIGENVHATIVMEETPLSYTYQWQYSQDNGETWKNSGLASARTDTYAFRAGKNDNMLIRCVVTDETGAVYISIVIPCVVHTGPKITAQPENLRAELGGYVACTVGAEGDDLTYQWQYSQDKGVTWRNSGLASAKTDTYAFTMGKGDIGLYMRCVITDRYGLSVTTEPAVLKLPQTIDILTQPADQDVRYGDAAAFTVKADGEELTYQWQYSQDNGVTWKNSGLACAKTDTYRFNAGKGDYNLQVRCLLKNSRGDEEYTEVAKLNETVIIVLDPGHDGSHGGASYHGLDEQIGTLKIAKACKSELESRYQNVKVYLTRETNTCINGGGTTRACLTARTEFAKQKNANAFVSLHLNASSGAARGALVFVPGDNYLPKVGQDARALARKILDRLVAMGLQDRGLPIEISSASLIASDPAEYTYPDGSAGDYYGVIRNAKKRGIPGMIVEHAFLDNLADYTTYLNSDEKLAALGQADAKGIADYYGLKLK